MSDHPDSGFHPLGCFYGGPEGEGFWFAVYGCELEHDGDLEPLWATPEHAAITWARLVLVGVTTELA